MERVIISKKTGEIFVFADEWNTSDGKVKQLKLELKPGKPIKPHYHPETSQSFKVLKGSLHVKVNNKTCVLSEGEYMKINASDEHSQWNQGPEVAIIEESYDPPLDIEPFFTMLPRALEHWNQFKFFILLDDFSHLLSTKSIAGQKAIRAFSRLGRLLGYANWYKNS